MHGNIKGLSIPDIFQLISSQGKSGALNISSDGRAIDFFFSEGRIFDAQPVQPVRTYHSLLGIMLRDAGYITDDELKRVLEVMEESEGSKIGDVIVERGVAPRDIVSKYLVLQIKECLFDILTCKKWRYKFEELITRPIPLGGEPVICPDILITEGKQFLAEYPALRQKFPLGDFLVRRKKEEHVDSGVFSEPEHVLWKALAFSDEPARVFRKACMTVFEGTKWLSALYDRGLIGIESASTTDEDAAGQGNGKARLPGWQAFIIKAVLWIGAGAVVLLWIRKLFLSPEAPGFFADWMRFFW